MKISTRELILAWLTMVFILLGISWFAARRKWVDWKATLESTGELSAIMEHNQKLLDERGIWEQRLDDIRNQLPSHPADKDVRAELLTNLEKLANKNSLTLTTRRAGDEEVSSNKLYEVSITCQWEGELASLVPFLFDIQETGVQYDIRKLRAVPAKKNIEKLSGEFTLDCAYSRQQAGNASEGL